MDKLFGRCESVGRHVWASLVGFCLLAALGLTAQANEPEYGGTLRIAYVATATHIDVNSVNQGAVNEVAHYFYETLFERDGDGVIQAHLVEAEAVSDDGLTVTWTLQPEVRFHDGSVFDAEAVKWNLERKIDRQQPLYDMLPIEAIDVLDELTVQITLSRPAPGMNAVLTTRTFSMYSPSFVEQVGDDALRSQASGTGPFRVVEFDPNEVLRLERNDDYWQEGLPYLDAVVFQIVPDINARASMLASGDVEMALSLSIPDVQRFEGQDNLRVIGGLGSNQMYIAVNNQKPPLDDVRVRKALNYALDRDGIIEAVLLGAAEPPTAIYINPNVDGWVEAGRFEYNPERAMELLEEAGWALGPDGIRQKEGERLSLELITRAGAAPGDIDSAELVQGFLQMIGVEVEISVLESAIFVGSVTMPAEEADYDLVNLSVGTFTGDAEYTMLTFYHTDSWAPRYYNRAYYSNPEVDRLIEQSLEVVSRQERDELYAEIIRMVWEDAPTIPLWDLYQYAVVRDNIHGVYFEGAGNNFPAKYAWIASD